MTTVSQEMPAPRRSTGLVAVVDALGAADYSFDRVAQYLSALNELLEETSRFAEQHARKILERFSSAKLERFVFQDTVIFVYESGDSTISIDEIVWFSHVLRTFEGGAFARQLLFRGAWAYGEFYLVSREANSVLGPAVRDAARWFERADWIGIHATPRTSMFVQSLIDATSRDIRFVLLDYDVPMKGGSKLNLKAINWPKNLHLRYPNSDAQRIRGLLEESLVADPIPVDAERKHFHARAFFDYVMKDQGLAEPWAKRSAGSNSLVTSV